MIQFLESILWGIGLVVFMDRILALYYETKTLCYSQRHFISYSVLWCIYAYINIHFHAHYVQIIFIMLFSTILFMGATIDVKHFILPDEGAIFLIFIGIVKYIWSSLTLENSMLNCLENFFYHVGIPTFIMGGVFYLLRLISSGGIGLGDVKWSMANVICLEGNHIWIMFLSAFILGALFVILEWIWLSNKRKYIAFGPFLNGGAVIAYWSSFLLGG